ncbi:uncharacterized protein LOC128670498 [Plodia interpunctella]|uniref:uncharacterized protein LOC128670498 n=1 Tax=Plodia interpunctella TaxID=58824 RepID=UPI002367673C|nr:uncharacterized protein LOC128670498 [Plodia interpunctella]
MGNNQSVRSTHFQPPSREKEEPDDFPEEHHISISNKMVERLVEDATLAGGAASSAAAQAPPRSDYKDKIFMEKLTCLDDNHSEKFGLTVEDLRATARRIELRTANMVSTEPVCAEYQDKVIDCYNTFDGPQRVVKCWDTVGAFKNCVRDATTNRLRARTHKEAREHARRTRHVAHAREHALRDLGPPRPEQDENITNES